jgi:aspartate racemase
MKRMGMIGGLSPEATIEYYKIITRLYRERSPDGDYPYMMIYSMNIHDFFGMMELKQWDRIVDWFVSGIEVLSRSGADFAFISANTPHVVFDEVNERSAVPLISIIEETLKVTAGLNIKKVGLFGTKFTMQSDFYQKAFSREGMEVIVPGEEEQLFIHKKLVEEICLGHIVEQTRRELLSIVKRMAAEHSIEGLVLGCTELPLIMDTDEPGIPFINTTQIHAESAVRYSLSG